MELVALLQRQEFCFVELFQTITDGLKDFWLLLPPVVGPEPAEHGYRWLIVKSCLASNRCNWSKMLFVDELDNIQGQYERTRL